MPKKTEKGDFSTSILSQNSKKMFPLKAGPFGGEKFRKVAQCRKKLKGDHLVSTDNVCYAEKKGKTFLVQLARPNGSI